VKQLIRVIFCLALAAGLSFGKDFMGIPIEEAPASEVRPLPVVVLGGGGFLRYYLNSIDGGVRASTDFRVHKHHSLTLPLISNKFRELQYNSALHSWTLL
jgi:hypothetical protein